ncbi:Sulfotransferase, partial [Candidatus Magnetoovum chiemensis]
MEDKPSKVVLWGVCDFAAKYIDYLREADISIAFFVDSYRHGTDFNGYNVISPIEYRNKFNDFRHIPVVITGRSANDEDRFVQITVYIINYLGLTDVCILHPAFLAKHIDIDTEGSAALLGFPGSGNVLLNKIIAALIERGSNKQCSAKAALFKRLSTEHFHSRIDFFDKVFYSCGANHIFNGSIQIGLTRYYAVGINSFAALHHLKSNHHIIDLLPHYHSIPDDKNIKTLKRAGKSKLFLPIRSPLDIIVSNAFKIHRAAILMYPEDDFYKSDSLFREMLGCRRLSNLNWFEYTATSLKDYMERVISIKQSNFIVKYEDLMYNPIETIEALSLILGVDIDKSEIDVFLSNRVNNK